MSRCFLILTCAFALIATACAPSASPDATDESDPDMAAASPAAEDRASTLSDPSATNKPGTSAKPGSKTPPPVVFRTPTPALDQAPNIPVGKAASAQSDIPEAGMVRLNGLVQTRAQAPVSRICVTLGPPIACAVLTDAGGKYEIDVPQGDIRWEFHFIKGGREVGPMVVAHGPFAGTRVGLETVTVNQ